MAAHLRALQCRGLLLLLHSPSLKGISSLGSLRISAWAAIASGISVKRSLFLISITCVPLALLAIISKVHWIKPPGQNFFLDLAAYGQLLIGLPMFLIAERVIDGQTRDAAGYFLTTGVVQPADASRLLQFNRQLARLRRQLWPDLICLGNISAIS